MTADIKQMFDDIDPSQYSIPYEIKVDLWYVWLMDGPLADGNAYNRGLYTVQELGDIAEWVGGTIESVGYQTKNDAAVVAFSRNEVNLREYNKAALDCLVIYNDDLLTGVIRCINGQQLVDTQKLRNWDDFENVDDILSIHGNLIFDEFLRLAIWPLICGVADLLIATLENLDDEKCAQRELLATTFDVEAPLTHIIKTIRDMDITLNG
jgi:hypothetical protein